MTEKGDKKILVCISGGIDSTVLATYLTKMGFQIYGVTIDYGHRAFQMELSAVKKIVDKLSIISHRVIKSSSLDYLGKIVHSPISLTDTELRKLNSTDDIYEEDISYELAREVWIPCRNAIICLIAAGYASALNIGKCYIGFQHDWKEQELISENRFKSYTDSTPDFIHMINKLLMTSLKNKVTIHTPFMYFDSSEMVKLGVELDAPLESTYSCAVGNKKHCGKCEHCIRRKRAYRIVGVNDPTCYEVD